MHNQDLSAVEVLDFHVIFNINFIFKCSQHSKADHLPPFLLVVFQIDPPFCLVLKIHKND